MKESIASIWITGIVITFMLIFSGYLAVTISYSSTIKMKNTVLSIIEKRYGITNMNGKIVDSKVYGSSKKVCSSFGTLQSINLYLRGNAYKITGPCTEGKGDEDGLTWYGVYGLYDTNADTKCNLEVQYEEAVRGKKYYYCFAKMPEREGSPKAYYKIRLFYNLELPIVNALNFTVDGRSNLIQVVSKCEIAKFRGDSKCPGEYTTRLRTDK